MVRRQVRLPMRPTRIHTMHVVRASRFGRSRADTTGLKIADDDGRSISDGVDVIVGAIPISVLVVAAPVKEIGCQVGSGGRIGGAI